jgi:hypothetical protein
MATGYAPGGGGCKKEGLLFVNKKKQKNFVRFGPAWCSGSQRYVRVARAPAIGK